MGSKNFRKAMTLTNVIVAPKKKIATFWVTKFKYYVVSQIDSSRSVLRTGVIDCSQPTIITPNTFLETFEGFSSEDIDFAEQISGREIERIKILGYQFKNHLKEKKDLNSSAINVIKSIKKQEAKHLSNIAIISAPNDVWSLALTKFAMETIFKSFHGNVRDLEERGFFMTDQEKRESEIEFLFNDIKKTKKRELFNELGEKLQEYGLFEQYEDRFFKLFKSIS